MADSYDEAPNGAATQNRLLAALPPDELTRLMPHLELVAAPIRYSFYEPDIPISHVYFIESGVASIVARMNDGEGVEVATVGNEGMIGLPAFLGAVATPEQAFMQVPGGALRMATDAFRREITPGCPLHALLQRYTQTLMIQMAQGVACNRLHAIEQRCSRWLLMTSDRVHDDTFLLTQEFLAQMLGVRRASVSEVAGGLQNDGLITYTRGVITILDRMGLEAHSCECYFIIRDEFERMLGASPPPEPAL